MWSRIIFFFNDTATTEIYTLSLHDALPISQGGRGGSRALRGAGSLRARFQRGGHRLGLPAAGREPEDRAEAPQAQAGHARSEEHTSELQSRQYLVCRLLLEKKKQNTLVVLY